MNIRRTIITLIAVAVLLGIGFAAMNYMIANRQMPEARAPEESRLFVRAKPVEYRMNDATITATGRLTSQHDIDLSAEVQGQILPGHVSLKEGTKFRKGDLLIRIFEEEAKNNLRASKSRFLNSIAGILPDIRIDFKESFDKWNDFFNAININQDLPGLPPMDSDKEKIFLASRNILNDYYSIQSAEVRLEKYRIYAPFNGSFTQVFMEVGSVANPGSRIATLIRTDKLELAVPVEVGDIYWVRIGDRVRITTEDGSREWMGQVVRKSDFVDPATQSITVYVSVESDGANPLFQGQYLKAMFETKGVENSMEIPRNAVFNKNQVYIIEDDRLKKSQVAILKHNQNTVLINGLPEGTHVVVEPLVNASEGTLAEILETK
jgi:multidrug efflux pump subunit AcrA (membrane-fusion protein)